MKRDLTKYSTYTAIRALLVALDGWTISIDDGDGEWQYPETQAEALEIIYSVESCHVHAGNLGTFFLITYGVNGGEAIADYSAKDLKALDAIVEPIQDAHQ